jgi:hypothetical protein
MRWRRPQVWVLAKLIDVEEGGESCLFLLDFFDEALEVKRSEVDLFLCALKVNSAD